MTKELLLLRHGKSDWRVEVDDFHRPLIERGKRGAELLGVWCQQQGIIPDFVLSSPATRALDTAQRFCHAVGIGEQAIYQEAAIYEANGATLKEIIAACPAQARRVLLVGHNPSLEHLLQDLLPTPLVAGEDGKILPTATLAHLTLGDYWSQTSSGCGQLTSLTRASALAEQFPFIALAGAQFRPRPAYYYSQVAAIPYCLIDNELKILLTRAAHKHRWQLPKGLVFPGLTPQAAVAKAAWEGAGLKGVVADEALGYDAQDKWQGRCVIQVFPLAVSDLMPEADWENKGRQRQWFTPKQAMNEINSATTHKMIKQLVGLLNPYLADK
jgi:phosphohistidine phosphatase